MGNKFGLTDLTQNELIECNGGWVQLVIGLFLPSIKRITDFVDGYKEGYNRGTANP
jgi:hypothetical protein